MIETPGFKYGKTKIEEFLKQQYQFIELDDTTLYQIILVLLITFQEYLYTPHIPYFDLCNSICKNFNDIIKLRQTLEFKLLKNKQPSDFLDF